MRFAAIAAGLSFLAVPALGGQPDASTENRTPASEADAKKKNEKVCKYIRTDMSSRRKEKVCMTAAEWIEFNRGE
ncbi:hypothetical protein GRI34_05240 [Erythrobacter aquimaris]|uniref:Uncharacterized protein n=1 Tax=Qipengyuania aquimaris TaxID=255984 RepID=A0A6I4TIR2_9SPHN|nr:hypothetical protein [Qipengyuania aquimaris]MXO95825.1 hypothetical protein [Qipengyuania aquimaris]